MTLTVRWTGYGREAAAALRDAVAEAKDGEPLAPVTVVVPSNHVGVASRRLLASGRLGPVAGTGVGLAEVTFATTYRLAELLGAARLAASGRRPVSTPVLAAAMRAELAAQPGLFTPVAEHPATESALVGAYRELRDLSVDALDAVAATSARAREVVRLHRAARARLAPAWSDEEDLLDAAVATVAERGASELGALVVHLPQRPSQHSARLLTKLAEHVPSTVIAGVTGVPEADAEVLTTLGRLGAGIDHANTVAPPVAAGRTTVFTASDADEEVRAAVRAVVDAVRAGTRLDRIALLHASPEPYARLAHEQLQAAGIATNGGAVVPLAGRVAGRTLLGLLNLADGSFRRQDVFSWLSVAPVLVDDRWAPVTAWERISREAAVVAGRHDWDSNLVRFAERQEAHAEAIDADDDEPAWRAERARDTAARARSLCRFALGVIDDLVARTHHPRPWSEHAAWAHHWLTELLGGAPRRQGWPDAERKAAERVELALDRLRALDEIEGPVGLDVFARTLELELEADLGRVGRFGDGVMVGSVEMGLGLDLDLVVVLGLAEGSFPATVHDDSLLPDGERMAAGGELALRADGVERQHRHLLGALTAADRHLLCVPRGDLRRSTERVPSRWVLDLAARLARTDDGGHADEPRSPSPPDLPLRAVWLHPVASFRGGLAAMTCPATAQEHRLRALLAAGGSLDGSDSRTAHGAEVIAARRSSRFTRFDGNLAGFDVPSPVAGVASASRLERWATCPHAHFLQDVLRAAPAENPEDALTITPIDKGNLVHAALEKFVTEVLDRPHGRTPEAHQPWTGEDRRLMRSIGEALCDDYEARGLTGRPLFWRRDRRRTLADLDRFLDLDAAHRAATGTSPAAVELTFGFGGDLGPVTLDLPDGRTLQVRGKADRIDLGTDGAVHVVDYKTGRCNDDYRGLSEEEPVLAGTKLQLPLYAMAGRRYHGDHGAEVVASYWFVTSKGEWKRKGYPVTEAVLERTVAVLAVIVEEIEAGVFPARPAANQSTSPFVRCPACDPDGLGTTELRRHWERKRHDPALARYAELAEPLDDEPMEVPA